MFHQQALAVRSYKNMFVGFWRKGGATLRGLVSSLAANWTPRTPKLWHWYPQYQRGGDLLYPVWRGTGHHELCGLMDKALVFGTKDPRFESCQCDFAHSPQIQAVARSHRFFLLALLRNWTLVPIPAKSGPSRTFEQQVATER